MTSGVRVFAIASLLDPRADKATHELWLKLENECQLKGIRLTPTPHFSWLGAEGYDYPIVKKVLAKMTKRMAPFRVQTSGLGLFTSPYPVLYLPIVKNRRLLEYHEQMHRHVEPFVQQPNRFYTPDAWVPHVTLANRDVTPEKLNCAVSGLLYRPLSFEITVDHLVMIYSIGDEVGMMDRFDFEGSDHPE